MGSAMGSGRSKVSLERMGMRSCASARKPLGVGLQQGKRGAATAFVLFLFEKIHNFDCAVTIFTQKH